MNYYWFSFSFEGENNGVCIVKADSKELAIKKTIELKIHPAHDSVMIVEIEDLDPNLEIDKLYPKEAMLKLGYVLNRS